MTHSHQWNAEIPSFPSSVSNSEQQQQQKPWQMTPSLSDHDLLTSHQNQPLPSTYTLYQNSSYARTSQSTQNQPSYSTDTPHVRSSNEN